MAAMRGLKDFTIASELGISETRVTQILVVIYRVLGVRNRVELAFEMGRHSNGKAA